LPNTAKVELVDADATEEEREQSSSDPAFLSYSGSLTNPTLWANLSPHINALAAREAKGPWNCNGIHTETPFYVGERSNYLFGPSPEALLRVCTCITEVLL
jgi:hypothetical protein